MADMTTKFTAADQTLAFALTWFCTEVNRPPKTSRMMVDVLRDVLGFANSDHPMVAPMIAAAHEVIDATEADSQSLGRSRASAEMAVAKFALWRAGRSYEVFREQYRGETHQANLVEGNAS